MSKDSQKKKIITKVWGKKILNLAHDKSLILSIYICVQERIRGQVHLGLQLIDMICAQYFLN